MTFQKGWAGGPGRPKGSRNFVTDFGAHNVAVVAERILAGVKRDDSTCLKIAADRLWPALSRSELSGIDGEAIQVDAPDWKRFTSEELAEIKQVAAAIHARRKAREAEANGDGKALQSDLEAFEFLSQWVDKLERERGYAIPPNGCTERNRQHVRADRRHGAMGQSRALAAVR